MAIKYGFTFFVNHPVFVGCHGRVGLEHRIQVLVVKLSECWFGSQSWPFGPYKIYCTAIASLHQGV